MGGRRSKGSYPGVWFGGRQIQGVGFGMGPAEGDPGGYLVGDFTRGGEVGFYTSRDRTQLREKNAYASRILEPFLILPK